MSEFENLFASINRDDTRRDLILKFNRITKELIETYRAEVIFNKDPKLLAINLDGYFIICKKGDPGITLEGEGYHIYLYKTLDSSLISHIQDSMDKGGEIILASFDNYDRLIDDLFELFELNIFLCNYDEPNQNTLVYEIFTCISLSYLIENENEGIEDFIKERVLSKLIELN